MSERILKTINSGFKNNIDISKIKIFKDKKTASAYIITDQADNQIAGFFPGAMMESISLKPIPLKNIDLAIVAPQNPIDMVELPFIILKRMKYLIYLTPDSKWPRFPGRN